MHHLAEPMNPLDTQSPERARTRELAMSAAWHGGLTRDLITAEGIPVAVVFRGHWSHGFGPDFSGAMIQVGHDPVRSGAVEIHRLSSDWTRHGHHLDPRYNEVVLHVVTRLDEPVTRRHDGAIVPTVVMNVPDATLFAIDQELPAIWDRLGGTVCAEDVANREPARIRSALLRLGDQRFTARTSRFEGELTVVPFETALLRGLFDAFGFSENREPFQALFDRLQESGTLARIAMASEERRWEVAASHLFGLAGFLPFSPVDAHLAGLKPDACSQLERRWMTDGANLGQWTMPATAWTRVRTRPANHPAARLAAITNLLGITASDPAPILLECLRSAGDIVALLRRLTGGGKGRAIGESRAVAIAASVVLPAAMAHAHHLDDGELEDAVSHAWAELPRAEWSRPARRALAQAAGLAPVGPLGERANQGLLHLDRALCGPRRCFECPIAAEVIRDRQRLRLTEEPYPQPIAPT